VRSGGRVERGEVEEVGSTAGDGAAGESEPPFGGVEHGVVAVVHGLWGVGSEEPAESEPGGRGGYGARECGDDGGADAGLGQE